MDYKLKRPTIKDCFYYLQNSLTDQELETFEGIQRLANRFVIPDDTRDTLSYFHLDVKTLSLEEYRTLQTALLVIYRSCVQLSRKEIYTLIFKLNGNNFCFYTEFADLAIDDLNVMVEVMNDYIEAENNQK